MPVSSTHAAPRAKEPSCNKEDNDLSGDQTPCCLFHCFRHYREARISVESDEEAAEIEREVEGCKAQGPFWSNCVEGAIGSVHDLQLLVEKRNSCGSVFDGLKRVKDD